MPVLQKEEEEKTKTEASTPWRRSVTITESEVLQVRLEGEEKRAEASGAECAVGDIYLFYM